MDIWQSNKKIWKLKSLCEAFAIWKFEFEMFEFGCVNIESPKLKIEMSEY
jgi:hypothetical protein